MASGSLRRYDVQARLSVIISLVSGVCMMILAGILYRNFDRTTMNIVYGAKSIYAPMVYGLTAATIFMAAAGAVLGFNSAGQRRNESQRQSWLGFFLGAAVLSFSIMLFAAFYLYRLAQR